jgi:hypothetical protein
LANGKPERSRPLLESICETFTQAGGDNPDLREARALLARN